MTKIEFLLGIMGRKQVWGKWVCVSVPKSWIRHEKGKKEKKFVENRKKKKSCEKNEKEVEKFWKRVLKCCLLKEGSKTFNSALSIAWIFPLC